MKRVSWPGVALVAGSTLFSWLTASPHTPWSAAPAAPSAVPGRVAPAPSATSMSALQLHDWTPPAPETARRDRNIFAFKRPGPKALPPPAPAADLLAPGGSGLQPALALFKLIGIADDAGSRTAIISGQGQLYLVKEGETVAFVYRVSRVAPESVELEDTTGGAPLRLFLK